MKNEGGHIKKLLWGFSGVVVGFCVAVFFTGIISEAFGGVGLGSFLKNNNQQNTLTEISVNVVAPESTESLIPPPQPKKITMIFVGDMMFDRGVETSVKNNFSGDFGKLFENLLEFKNADIVFGNLEGPVSDKGYNVGSKWSFRMDPASLSSLANAGFNIVSFANNHVGDYTQAAFEDTLLRLTEHHINYTGAGTSRKQAETPTIIEKNGMRIGFLGFTDVGPNWMEAQENKAGILLASDTNFRSIIEKAQAQVDFLVVSFHWGSEYSPHNSRQTERAHTAIDAGADMIIGHHPHVIQDTELYKGKFIAYSLGNFIFDQYFSNETMQGMVVEVTLEEADQQQEALQTQYGAKKNITVQNITKKIVELDRRYQPQTLRPFEETDVVRSKIATNSLCPTISKWYADQWLFNVNRENSLGKYEPQQLTHMNNRIDARGTATCLVPEAADALENMFNDAHDAGMKLVMTSGYRQYSIQKMLYDKNQAEQPNAVYPSVAEPGHSEHQLGTTVDLKSLQTTALEYSLFGTSPEYYWLVENAYKFGFVQSYPQGKEHITGYIPEPWHWRYVGVDVASKVKESGLTLMEFLSENTL